MSKDNYQCRRCGKKRSAGWKETDPTLLGRVVCFDCGGTCDPTPEELSRIAACDRSRAIQVYRQGSVNVGSRFDSFEDLLGDSSGDQNLDSV